MFPTKSRTPPPLGDVPYRLLFLGSEVAEACTEGVEVVSIGIRRCSEVREAVSIRRRHRAEAGESAEGRHRHHSETAGKGRLHRSEVGFLNGVFVEAGVDDFDRYFGLGRSGLGLGFCLAGFPALGTPFGGGKLRGGFLCFRLQDGRPGCAWLSPEDLHIAEKANGHHGQEDGDIGRNRDQRVRCLRNSNSVCRDILNSLLTASCYRCPDALASVSNNVAEKTLLCRITFFNLFL